jgi:hypothetical protein
MDTIRKKFFQAIVKSLRKLTNILVLAEFGFSLGKHLHTRYVPGEISVATQLATGKKSQFQPDLQLGRNSIASKLAKTGKRRIREQ